MDAELLKTNTGEIIPGPLLLTPKVFRDERGFFLESWNNQSFNHVLSSFGQDEVNFVQDNHSYSTKGVLRGLHYQINPHPQAKLVRCIKGKIFDVIVDLRPESASYGCWASAVLSKENFQQFWVPVGFAHGFLVISDEAEVLYKTTDFWSSECERSIRWDDPNLLIDWPLEELSAQAPNLSQKDSEAPLFSEL